MIDLSKTIAAKSDQLNSDDLIGNPITVTVTGVNLLAGEQPVSISFQGDNGKPWKPCKSMRRVLVTVWGKNGNDYIGRSLTLYRDPNVSFGGQAVGGIRISHMSDVEKSITMSLTAAKNSKKPFTVQPLKTIAPQSQEPINEEQLIIEATEKAGKGKAAFTAYWQTLTLAKRDVLRPNLDKLQQKAQSADNPFPESDDQPGTRIPPGLTMENGGHQAPFNDDISQ